MAEAKQRVFCKSRAERSSAKSPAQSQAICISGASGAVSWCAECFLHVLGYVPDVPEAPRRIASLGARSVSYLPGPPVFQCEFRANVGTANIPYFNKWVCPLLSVYVANLLDAYLQSVNHTALSGWNRISYETILLASYPGTVHVSDLNKRSVQSGGRTLTIVG